MHTPLWARCAVAVVLSQATAAMAKTPASGKQQGTRVTIHNSPSAETSAERDRRLTRECKGRPNAGACLGYARP
jgi:hypothetical protein